MDEAGGVLLGVLQFLVDLHLVREDDRVVRLVEIGAVRSFLIEEFSSGHAVAVDDDADAVGASRGQTICSLSPAVRTTTTSGGSRHR